MKARSPSRPFAALLATLVMVAFASFAIADDNLMLDRRIAPAKARVERLRKQLDDYRDHASDSDFTNVWVQTPGGPQLRRIPTEEFQARIERTEAELRAAEQELKSLERSLD